MGKPDPCEYLPGGNLNFSGLITPDEFRHHRVFDSGKFRQKMMELKDETHMPVPEIGQLLNVPFKNILVFEEHFPARWLVQAPKQVK